MQASRGDTVEAVRDLSERMFNTCTLLHLYHCHGVILPLAMDCGMLVRVSTNVLHRRGALHSNHELCHC
jgi:hypothetical protein